MAPKAHITRGQSPLKRCSPPEGGYALDTAIASKEIEVSKVVLAFILILRAAKAPSLQLP